MFSFAQRLFSQALSLFPRTPTDLQPLLDFLSFLLSSSHPLSLIFYALSLSRFCYGHGWSLSLFPNVTSLTVVANGSPFSHCGFGGSLLYGSWFVVRFSWVFVVIWFWLSFGNGGGCCDLILAGFQPLWWWLWFDFGWVLAVVVVVWIWLWLGFDNGVWLEVGGDELKKFRPWRFREKQKERGRKNKT